MVWNITLKPQIAIKVLVADDLSHPIICTFIIRSLIESNRLQRYQAYKHHWSDTRLPVVLEVTPYSLDQLDPATNMPLASYYFKDFEGLATMKDYTDGFVIVCGGFGRLHLFASPQMEEIKKKLVDSAMTNLGIVIKVLKEPIKLEEFIGQRLGKFSGDEHITSVSEFTVHKNSSRHSEPQRRTLCLSDTCLLERDPQTYSICTLRPLSDVFALVRDYANPQLFTIQYLNGEMRSYMATDRDSLLASLLDGVRASGNRDVHVTMSPIARGKRLGPLNLPVDEEVETCHLKFIQQNPGGRSFAEILERFNANVPYSGLHYSLTQDVRLNVTYLPDVNFDLIFSRFILRFFILFLFFFPTPLCALCVCVKIKVAGIYKARNQKRKLERERTIRDHVETKVTMLVFFFRVWSR